MAHARQPDLSWHIQHTPRMSLFQQHSKYTSTCNTRLISDFLIVSESENGSEKKGLLFVSGVPKSWSWTSSVGADEVVRWVYGLQELAGGGVCGCVLGAGDA